jgi:hypothetical protein
MLPSLTRLALHDREPEPTDAPTDGPTDALSGSKRKAAAGPSESTSPPRVVQEKSHQDPSDTDAYLPQRFEGIRCNMLPWFNDLEGATFAYTINLPTEWRLVATEAFRRGTTGFVFKGTFKGEDAAIVVRALDTPVPMEDVNNPFHDEPFEPRRCVKMTSTEFSRSVEKLRKFDEACFKAASLQQVTPRLFEIGQFGGSVELAGPHVTDAKRASLAAVQFGVEVWELWDMSMESYLRFHAVPLSSVESQNLKGKIELAYKMFTERTNHWITDLHLGNVFVRLSETEKKFDDNNTRSFPAVEKLVLGDFGGARDKEPSDLPTDDLMDEFESLTDMYASGDDLNAGQSDTVNWSSTLADGALSRRRLV